MTFGWLNAFELMCYLIVALLLVSLVRKKDFDSLFTFGAAAIVGFAMELLAVAVTDIYYYNPGFWLNIGTVPKQFPVFGGLMWGGLTVCGIRLAQKLALPKGLTALCAGLFIVTMDLLLDAVAIRLDGGFWTWVGTPVTEEITQSAFLSVLWVNFLGYMIETPAVVWLTLKKRERVAERDWKKQTASMLLIALAGIAITAAGSLIALGLNRLTNDWFACIAFLVVWIAAAIVIIVRTVRLKLRFAPIGRIDIPVLLFWLAMYAYCIAGIADLGLYAACPWFLALGIVFALGTVCFSALDDGPA